MNARKIHPIEEFLFRTMLDKNISSGQQLKFVQASLKAITQLNAAVVVSDVYTEFKHDAGGETGLIEKDFQQDFLPNFESWYEHNDREGTMLTWAAAEDYPQYVRLLVESKADINSKIGNVPIHVAVQLNKLASLKELIAAKADLNFKNPVGATALMYAAQRDSDECLSVLIESKADLNAKAKNQNTALMIAASSNQSQRIKKLVLSKADIDCKNTDGKTALMIAADFGHDECLQVLIESKADLNATDKGQDTAFTRSAWKGQKQCMQKLIAAKADIDHKDLQGKTALMKAADFGHDECLQVLIESKADLNATDKGQDTAFTRSAWKGQKQCMQKLIVAKADINHKDIQGKTALMWAGHKGFNECLQVLIESKADLNAKDQYQVTALTWTAGVGSNDCLQALIDSKADLNVKNNNNRTALMAAVWGGKVESVKKLLAANVDITGIFDFAKNEKKDLSMISLISKCNMITPHHNLPIVQEIHKMGGECKLGEKEIHSMLDKYIPDIAKLTLYQWSAVLIYAVINNNPAAVKWFFMTAQQHKINTKINFHDKNGMTALMHSMAYTDTLRDSKEDSIVRKRCLVDMLIEQTWQQPIKIEDKLTELSETIETIFLFNNLYALNSLVNYLIRHADEHIKFFITFLGRLFERAVTKNNLEILNLLIGIIEKDAKFDLKNKIIKECGYLVYHTIEKRKLNIAEILVCHDFITRELFVKMDGSYDDRSPLHSLIDQLETKKISINEILQLSQLILVKCNGMQEMKDSALISVSKLDTVEMTRLLIEHKANINTKKSFLVPALYSPALDKAVRHGNIDTVKFLLSQGAISTSQTLKLSDQPLSIEKKDEVEKFYRTKKYMQVMHAITVKNPQTSYLCAELNPVDQNDMYELFKKHPLNEKGWIDKLFADRLVKVVPVTPSAPLEEKAKVLKPMDIEKEVSLEGLSPDYVQHAIAQRIAENGSKEIKHEQIEGKPNAVPKMEDEPGHPALPLPNNAKVNSPASIVLPAAFFGNGNKMTDRQYTDQLIQLINQNPEYWTKYPNGTMVKKMLEAFYENVSDILNKPQHPSDTPRIDKVVNRQS